MIKNSFKLFFRTLLKNKIFSAINIFGLAIGIASCVIIAKYVYDEMTFDSYHVNADRLYRIEEDNWAAGRMALGPYIRNNFPEVEQAVRFYKIPRNIFTNGDQHFIEKKGFYTDASIFEVFSYSVIAGDPKTALNAPNSIVLTRALASKYFGDENPIDRSLKLGANSTEYKITGVMDNVPSKSHFTFDYLVSMSTLQIPEDNVRVQWGISIMYTYLLIKPGVDVAALEKKVAKTLDERDLTLFGGSTQPSTVKLQPIENIHLYSKCEKEIEPGNDSSNLLILTSVAFFILATAVFNFVNLATAGFMRRAKEVGLRKTFGALRDQVIRQFLTESILMALSAAVSALILIEILTPFLSDTITIRSGIQSLFEPMALVYFAVFSLLVGCVAGLFPALFLSKFQPAHILKQNVMDSQTIGVRGLKKTLLVLQFVISTILIIGSSIVYKQLEFIQNKDIGLDKEQVLIIPASQIAQPDYNTFKNILSQNPAVSNVSASLTIPSERVMIELLRPEAAEKPEYALRVIVSDFNFVETFGMRMAEGRSFSTAFPSDSLGAFLINEKAKALFGYTDPVGKNVEFPGFQRSGKIVGVVKDFNFASLHNDVEPAAIHLNPVSNLYSYISVRLTANSIQETLQFIGKTWESLRPNVPFEYYFLDDSFAALYQSEMKLQALVRIFTLMAVVIACLGLFGLVSLTVEQRTKEIGIRKVLGAGIHDILFLVSKDFLFYVIIANMIAWPLIYYVMYRWLENFSYRVDIPWSVFVATLGLSLFLALVTISYRVVKAAVVNPIHSIKYE
ncbi:ABC transporter permease [bacterium]|nr:ABC transporter permease [bacterium]